LAPYGPTLRPNRFLGQPLNIGAEIRGPYTGKHNNISKIFSMLEPRHTPDSTQIATILHA